MASEVPQLENERLLKLFNSPLFLQKLMAIVPDIPIDEFKKLLFTYQQKGRVSTPEFESAALRLNTLHSIIQLYQLPQLSNQLSIARLFLRFSFADPQQLSSDQHQLFAGLSTSNTKLDQAELFYQDEWLLALSQGEIVGLSGPQPEGENSSNEGKYQLRLAQFERELSQLLTQHKTLVPLFNHVPLNDLPVPVAEPYPSRIFSSDQRKNLLQIEQQLRQLLDLDKSYCHLHAQYQRFITLLSEKGLSKDLNNKNVPALKKIRAEAKHLQRIRRKLEGEDTLPAAFLHSHRLQPAQLASHERVIEELSKLERLDPGLFVRRFRNQYYRYSPQILLLPIHASHGNCWQAFDKMDRAHSRSLLILPMYPLDLQQTLIATLAELRWQTAKQLAGSYWLSEGLTSHYCSWLHKNRSKSNEQEHFVSDYCNWIIFESKGNQRCPNELRQILWQWLPFPPEHCQSLSKRHAIYANLHQRFPPGKKPGEVKISKLSVA